MYLLYLGVSFTTYAAQTIQLLLNVGCWTLVSVGEFGEEAITI